MPLAALEDLAPTEIDGKTLTGFNGSRINMATLLFLTHSSDPVPFMSNNICTH